MKRAIIVMLMICLTVIGVQGQEIETDLYYAIGNPDSDVVIINTQGGPMPALLTDEFAEVFASVDLDNALVINVHQSHTLNPDRINEQAITFEEAQAMDAETVQILAGVVEGFINEGKRVYVTGFSFGAFVVQDLLATQGNVADGYLIQVGRLDIPEEVWIPFSEGGGAYFVDGVEVVSDNTGTNDVLDSNLARLAAGLGYKRYTELLSDVDLSNVTYIYGQLDEAVGRLTDTEVTFLENNGATVISTPGGHGSAEIDEVTNNVLAQFVNPDLSTIMEASSDETSLPISIDELITVMMNYLGIDSQSEFEDYINNLSEEETLVAVQSALGLDTFADAENLLNSLMVRSGGDNYTAATFVVNGEVALMTGVIDSTTPNTVQTLIDEHPNVTTIVMYQVDGSVDDEANLVAARLVRQQGFNTHVPSDGVIASGGVDFFLAGNQRTIDDGAMLGVHSWGSDDNTPAVDVPRDDPQHQLYLDYYDEMGIPADFYWFTLAAAPAESIHWMTAEEIEQYQITTTP